jgi:glutathione S-transferase
MIKIWGRGTSSNVQKVIWLAAEIGLKVERTEVGGKFGGLDTPEYGAMNPNRLVPTLQDGDFYLWDSHAVMRYLMNTYEAGSLWPDDAKQRAHADQWMEWNVSTLWVVVRLVFLGLLRTPPEQRDEKAMAANIKRSGELFQLLVGHLADRDYVTGDQFTAGDIPIGVSCYRYMELDIARPDTPHVVSWYERLQEREAYRRLIMLPLG